MSYTPTDNQIKAIVGLGALLVNSIEPRQDTEALALEGFNNWVAKQRAEAYKAGWEARAALGDTPARSEDFNPYFQNPEEQPDA